MNMGGLEKSTIFSGDEGLQQVALAVCRRMLRLFGVDGSAVLLRHAGDWRLGAAAGLLEGSLALHPALLHLANGALARGSPNDASETAQALGLAGEALQGMAVPLWGEGGALGALLLVRQGGAGFSEEEQVQGEVAAESVSMSLQLHWAGERLKVSESQYRLMFRASPLPMYVSTFETRLMVDVNEAMLRLYGYTEAEFMRLHVTDLLYEQDPRERQRLMDETAPQRRIRGLLRRHRTREGVPLDVEIWTDEIEMDGRAVRLVLIYDVTARLRAERELARVSRAQLMLSACNEALARCHSEAELLGHICTVAETIGGYFHASVGLARHDERRSIEIMSAPGRPDDRITPRNLSWDEHSPSGRGPAALAIRTGQTQVVSDIEARAKDFIAFERLREAGVRQVVSLPLSDDGQVLGVLQPLETAPRTVSQQELDLMMELSHNLAYGIGYQRARALREQAEQHLAHLAYHDTLTGLPNRACLLERLQQAQERAVRDGHWGALLMLDIDHFKVCNEIWGHETGDRLLQVFAQRLRDSVEGLSARLGGDEFAVLIEGLGKDGLVAADKSRRVGEHLLQALAGEFHLDAVSFPGHSSLGLVPFNGHDGSPGEVLQRAEIALHAAKAGGRRALRTFDLQLQASITEAATLERDLREALQRREFVLYYQLQVDAHDRATGVEALVRWHSARRGMVSPGLFIPACEEAGLIVELGRQVLEVACDTLAQWSRQPAMAHLMVAVNVSSRQFRQPDFVATVLQVLERSGAPPGRLKLELTESAMVDDIDEVIDKMATLKARGIAFSLDDFGTGYSSLSYLKRLPLDQLKIDQSFVRDILTDPNDAAIACTVIALGHSLGLEVIAEGVENQAQQVYLTSHGCAAFQGYHLGRPMPLEQLQQAVLARTGNDPATHETLWNPGALQPG